MDDNLRIWRSFQMGKLFDLIMLDTRNYDRSITSLSWNDGYVTKIVDDASRTLMGSHQENWFYGQLSKSAERGATWRIIGNQIVFSRLQNPAKDGQVNLDGWDVSKDCLLQILRKTDDCRATLPTATALYTIYTLTTSPTTFSLQAIRTQIGYLMLHGCKFGQA